MSDIDLGRGLRIAEEEIEITAIRAQGAGGQNVNKVSSAVHLRFPVAESSLPEAVKARLLAMSDQRITKEGVVVIKGQQYRTQEKNREDALARLRDLVSAAATPPKKRIPTRPGKKAKARRVDEKKQQGRRKQLRGKVEPE